MKKLITTLTLALSILVTAFVPVTVDAKSSNEEVTIKVVDVGTNYITVNVTPAEGDSGNGYPVYVRKNGKYRKVFSNLCSDGCLPPKTKSNPNGSITIHRYNNSDEDILLEKVEKLDDGTFNFTTYIWKWRGAWTDQYNEKERLQPNNKYGIKIGNSNTVYAKTKKK